MFVLAFSRSDDPWGPGFALMVARGARVVWVCEGRPVRVYRLRKFYIDSYEEEIVDDRGIRRKVGVVSMCFEVENPAAPWLGGLSTLEVSFYRDENIRVEEKGDVVVLAADRDLPERDSWRKVVVVADRETAFRVLCALSLGT